MNEQELLQELLQRYPDPRKTLYPEDWGGIATPAGAGMLNGLGARPPEPVTGTGLQTAGGSWKRTVSSKGAGGVTALCPVESRLYLGLAGSEKVRSANL